MKPLPWLGASAAVAVIVAGQVIASVGNAQPVGAPTVQPGTDVLAGISVVERRIRGGDYLRSAFGEAWDDENSAPGGHNGCDTRDDILTRDLDDTTFVATKRCPQAVATGSLRDPYTNAVIGFTRGNQVGASVQIDHIVPLAYAWDMGARDWPEGLRKRFANDPANLLAVDGQANQDKGDLPPGEWMPPHAAFGCQYAVAFIAVVRGYHLAVEQDSAQELRRQTETCPAA